MPPGELTRRYIINLQAVEAYRGGLWHSMLWNVTSVMIEIYWPNLTACKQSTITSIQHLVLSHSPPHKKQQYGSFLIIFWQVWSILFTHSKRENCRNLTNFCGHRLKPVYLRDVSIASFWLSSTRYGVEVMLLLCWSTVCTHNTLDKVVPKDVDVNLWRQQPQR